MPNCHRGGSSDMINNAADLQQEERSESATHIESTPQIAPSTQFRGEPPSKSEQKPPEIVESAVVRNNSSGEVMCFMCGQMGDIKPFGTIKTRMLRLFQKDEEVKTQYNSWSKESKQDFCAALHGVCSTCKSQFPGAIFCM